MRKKYDWILYSVLAALFAASCATAGLIAMSSSSGAQGGAELIVVLGGETLLRKPLADLSGEYSFGGEKGFNMIRVEDGAVKMASADCPGGDCLRMRAINSRGGVIVCLPHRFTARIESIEEPPVDAVSF
jgi:hypothetical protein